jgi:electron transfer flavoprotein alpha subunit
VRVLVVSEEAGGAASSSSLEMLTKARDLGNQTEAFHVGAGGQGIFDQLAAHGATQIHHFDPGDELPAAPAAAVLTEIAGPSDAILFALTPTGRDIAGRLAARLDVPVLSNAVDISAGETLTVVNEILGGTTLVETAFQGTGPYLIVVRPKSFAAEVTDSGTPEISTVAAPEGAPGARIVSSESVASEGPSLEDADVIVAGGRGLGGSDNFEMVYSVARALNAAVGATRAVVDSGWVPYSMQVGQTGKTVKPQVYIACGISGAMQHLVGMKDSGVIIAINKDEDAPIFGVADLGVVGDVHQVMPKLIEALESR